MSTTKKLCINALGIALFVVLTLCLQVPVFENYYLCLGYIVMAVYLYFVGGGSGILVGTMGVIIYCVITGGMRGMPGWALGNAVIGLLCAPICKWISHKRNPWFKIGVLTLTVMIPQLLVFSAQSQ